MADKQDNIESHEVVVKDSDRVPVPEGLEQGRLRVDYSIEQAINPCPNLKCITHDKQPPHYITSPRLDQMSRWDGEPDKPNHVRCICGLTGPLMMNAEQAIAAWNSIRMFPESLLALADLHFALLKPVPGEPPGMPGAVVLNDGGTS